MGTFQTRSGRSNARDAVPVLMLGMLVVSAVTVSATVEEIGRSIEGRPITAETFGSGPIDVLVVGGIHGAYEANSIALAKRFSRYLRDTPGAIPERFTIHVIETMNPDGLHRITGGTPIDEFDFRSVNTRPGRFNARWVDLNRNWDGDWRPVSYWGQTEVDAGTAPFSEPETRAVRDYFLRIRPTASIFYQSAGSFIWYSGAEDGWQPSLELALAYGRASGYRVIRPDPAERDDDGFDITGSADDYFYEIGHRNITVELTNHYEIEWERNLAGFRAFLDALDE
jgi:hypothetical protein